MSDKDQQPTISSMAYDAMLPVWQKVQTVLNGTDAMRAAKQTYLPQHYGETDTAYEERADRATLLNITKLTLHSWVGRPFSAPVQFDDLPKQVEDLLSNVDLIGTDSQVFLRDWFLDGMAKAYSHVYVEFPRTDTVEGVRTKADDAREGVRPYWIHLRPEQVFFAASETVDGREVLNEIRIWEELIEQVGFAERVVNQIRRVFIDETGSHVELYRQDPNDKKGETWFVHDEYDFSLDFIPLVTFYANRDGFMSGTPPLLDLTDLNIAHWQSTSDQRAILTVTRFPVLALSGASEEGKELVIGPNRWLHSPDAQGKFYYVEHSGKAIEAGRKDLQDLEEQMAEYGADFLRKRSGSVTATARVLDSAEATSPLQDVTLRFAEAVNQVLEYTAAWLKESTSGSATLTTEFGPAELSQPELNTLRETRKMKDISREAYLSELQKRGVLCEDYKAEEDAILLEAEAIALAPMMQEFEEELDEEGEKPGEGKEPGEPGEEEE